MEALSGTGEHCDIIDSSGETDAQEESICERTISREKKSKRHREDLDGLEEKSIPWIFGYCWPPISVLRTL